MPWDDSTSGWSGKSGYPLFVLLSDRFDFHLPDADFISDLQKADERALGLNSDPSDKTHWLYTSQAIFELVVSDEDRDVWRIMLKREEYEPSLKFAKTPQQKDLILSAQADAFFAQGRFHQAAAKYALCSKSFEEVVLRFVDVGERDAMRYYLNSRLDGLKKTVSIVTFKWRMGLDID